MRSEDFSSTWPNLRILVSFTKFFHKSLFAMIVPLPKSKRVIQHAHALSSLSHTSFFDVTNFYKSIPGFSQLLSQNLAKTLLVLAPDMLSSCGDKATSYAQEKLRTEEGFVKSCRV